MLLPLADEHVVREWAHPRCQSCAFRPECGTYQQRSPMFNCFDMTCCGTGRCDEVCPGNPRFFDRLVEVHGLCFDDLGPLPQAPVALPMYIPHVPHRYSRQIESVHPWIAISPYQLLRQREGRHVVCVENGADLRRLFKVRADANVVLRGVDVDRSLERFWAFRRRDQLAEQFRRLNVSLFIGPNFSHFGDVPRTDNLFNRKRQLICLAEMADAGLNVAPHLNDAAGFVADWEFWFSYLKESPAIHIVAKEFQTRTRTVKEGVAAINRLDELQQRLGRALHPIAIGGGQFTEELAKAFERFSVLDCRPVINGMHYYRFIPRGQHGRWLLDPSLPGLGADRVVHANVALYSQWIERRAAAEFSLRRMQ